jgi:hypothetical protein
VIMRWVGRGRQSGARYDRRAAAVYQVNHGLVVRLTVFDSLASAATAIGL